MVGTWTTSHVLKWILTAICLLILGGLVYSMRRSVIWHSSNLRYEVGLARGGIGFGWRPAGWRLKDERYPPGPGLVVASHDGSPSLRWWFDRGRNRHWEWLSIPLWMVFILAGIPAAVLWYRQRRGTRDAIRRCRDWLTPDSPRKTRLWLILCFWAVHVALIIAVFFVFLRVYAFFVYPRSSIGTRATGAEGILLIIVDSGAAILFWTSPLWAILWAWLFTRFRNRLFQSRRGNFCSRCGYNLTGNVSGVCPECGVSIRAERADGPAA